MSALSDLTPEQQDVELLMSAIKKVLNVDPLQFPVVPGGTPTFVKANRRMKELASKAYVEVQHRQMLRAIEAEEAALDAEEATAE